MRVLAVFLVAVLLSGCSSVADRWGGRPEGGERTLTVDGRERTYRVHVPEAAAGPLPVLLVLHGGGGDGEQVARQTGLSDAADDSGFIAVYPDGTGRTSLLTWNSGNCCAYAHRERVDDVAFVSALLDELLAEYPADPERVFATGMSNGAMMSYRLACELSDRVAGIAPVAGALNVESCAPTRPVSVLAVNGTSDRLVPYAGGPPSRPAPGEDGWTNTSVADSVGFWVDHDQCAGPPRETRGGAVTVTTHTGCADGSEVVLYTVDGGGHAWPGGRRSRPAADAVPSEPDATRVIADFVTRER